MCTVHAENKYQIGVMHINVLYIAAKKYMKNSQSTSGMAHAAWLVGDNSHQNQWKYKIVISLQKCIKFKILLYQSLK